MAVKIPIFFSFAFVGIISAIGTLIGFIKMRSYRKEMEEKISSKVFDLNKSPILKSDKSNSRKREVWMVFYGIFVALFIQVLYDSFGFLGEYGKQ